MDNIAIIITKLYGGGAERVASNLSIELSKTYNVKLIVFDDKNIIYPYCGDLISLDIPATNNKFMRFINVFKRSAKLKKIKKENNIKCSISLLDGPNIVNVLSRDKDKVITSVRNFLSDSEKTNIVRKVCVRIISNCSDKVVAISEVVKQDLIENIKVKANKVVTIYNSCDGERLAKLSLGKELSEFEDKKYICTMGRLTHQKGQWHLIRAFKEVIKSNPELNLIILGEGELREKLNNLIKDLGLEEKVKLIGYIENPHDVIRNSEMFIFPSLYEGLGNALLEALSCGVPIISTDCNAGPREILAPSTDIKNKAKDKVEIEEYGILVPNFNNDCFCSEIPLNEEEKLLVKAINMLIKDDKLKSTLKEKALKRVKDFSPLEIEKQWIKLIDE